MAEEYLRVCSGLELSAITPNGLVNLIENSTQTFFLALPRAALVSFQPTTLSSSRLLCVEPSPLLIGSSPNTRSPCPLLSLYSHY